MSSHEEKDTSEEVAVPHKFQKLVEEIEKMTVLDLSELVKVLEKKFGVSSAMPIAVASVQAAGSEAGTNDAGAENEKTTFIVELAETGANKIGVIKAIRSVTTLGLKEAKDIAEGAPAIVLQNATKDDAEKAKKALEEAGAKVTLK